MDWGYGLGTRGGQPVYLFQAGRIILWWPRVSFATGREMASKMFQADVIYRAFPLAFYADVR